MLAKRLHNIRRYGLPSEQGYSCSSRFSGISFQLNVEWLHRSVCYKLVSAPLGGTECSIGRVLEKSGPNCLFSRDF